MVKYLRCKYCFEALEVTLEENISKKCILWNCTGICNKCAKKNKMTPTFDKKEEKELRKIANEEINRQKERFYARSNEIDKSADKE